MAAKKTDWMETIEDTFLKLPPLPKNAVQTLVTVTPWFALIFGIWGLLLGLAGFGLMTFVSPFVAMSTGISGATGSLVTAGVAIASSVVLILAFPGTKAHKMKGWQMLFWSEALSTLGAVLAFSLSGIIIAAIGFYLLFQIKPSYKK